MKYGENNIYKFAKAMERKTIDFNGIKYIKEEDKSANKEIRDGRVVLIKFIIEAIREIKQTE